MASNRIFRVGPLALTNTLTTNILNAAAAGAGTGYTPTASYIILNHVRIVNKHASTAAKVSLWLGASAGNVAGTEFIWFQTAVAVGSFIEAFGRWRLDAADFLVGGSDTATALTFEAEGEVGLV